MGTTAHRRLGSIAVVVALLAGSACSSDGSDGVAQDDGATAAIGEPTTTTAGEAPPAAERRACPPEASDPVTATEVAGSETDLDVTSFDGTTIRAHWFPVDGADAQDPAPTVLMGPGWSLAGDTSLEDGVALFGGASIPSLHDAGYHVLTWDPRGFGESGGAASVNDPALEGRDVQTLIDLVSAQPEALLDGDGDPRLGMVGLSYGGGIQLTVAALDCRVDVIVPGLGWHSLQSSLYKNDTVKAGWSGILSNIAADATLDPHIPSAAASGLATGTLSDDDFDWFVSRGPGDLVDQIDIPTLFIQGTVDTLFTLDESITNHRSLADRGVPTAQLWFCGGHGTCRTEGGDLDRYGERTFAWLARYLDGDETAEVGPALELVDQDGVSWEGDDYPLPAGEPITASGSGTLEQSADGGAGPLAKGEAGDDALGGLVGEITPNRATNAVEVAVDPGDVDTMALGAPTLSLTYRGSAGPEGDAPEDRARPTRIFAQLVDDETGIVVGNQITPIEVTLDGEEHEVAVDLEVIAHHLHDGHTLTLQIVAVTTAYAVPRLGGTVELSAIDLTIPTTDALVQRG